jgi:hypothetical protein
MLLPAKLYKYQAFTHHTVDGLRQATLWFGTPAGFNDPFDCAQPIVSPVLTDEDLGIVFERVASAPKAPRRQLEAQFIKSGEFTEEFRTMARTRLKAVLEERVEIQRHKRGVTCFAESNTDLLMWAHYADGHRGFCLEFDTRAEFFSKVIQVAYAPDFPQLGPVEIFDDDPSALVQAMIGTKSECWSYEREWRVPHIEPNKKYRYAYGVLTGIYLGAAMPEDRVTVIRRLFWNTPTKVYRMRQSQTGFSLLSEPEQTTVY